MALRYQIYVSISTSHCHIIPSCWPRSIHVSKTSTKHWQLPPIKPSPNTPSGLAPSLLKLHSWPHRFPRCPRRYPPSPLIITPPNTLQALESAMPLPPQQPPSSSPSCKTPPAVLPPSSSPHALAYPSSPSASAGVSSPTSSTMPL